MVNVRGTSLQLSRAGGIQTATRIWACTDGTRIRKTRYDTNLKKHIIRNCYIIGNIYLEIYISPNYLP